jgi:hypothetical protein
VGVVDLPVAASGADLRGGVAYFRWVGSSLVGFPPLVRPQRIR